MKESSLEKITKAISSEIDAFGEVMDVTKFRELQKQLEKFLIRDALTLVLNRWKFEDVLEREIKRAKDEGTPLSVMFLDVDKFKVLNDCFGHVEGDSILCSMIWEAEYIAEKTIGKSHRIGRWGGDEFIYLFPSKSPVEVLALGEAINDSLSNKYMQDLFPKKVSFSIGICSLRKSDNVDKLISRADKAMYKAKKKGGNRVEIINS